MIKFNDFEAEYETRSIEYKSAAERVLSSGWYILGKEVEKFEKKFASYLGVKYCVGVGNGMEALQIALMTLGIGNGDEVITTPVSAVATTLSIMSVGATPVFSDVNEKGQIDASLIEKLITNKTKAIIPVHLYGQPCGVDRIRRICKKHKLYLIEDAAQAHGAIYKGKKLGSCGEIGCFSFYPTKNIGAFGDGGALVTNSKKYAEIFRIMRDYGQKSKYVHTHFGLNSRLDEIQAAFLSIKLNYLDKDNLLRRKIAERYIRNLRDLNEIEIVLPERLSDSNFHLFVIKIKRRDELKNYLAKNYIPTLIHYPIPIPDQPLFSEKYKRLKIPNARRFVKEVLSLPCYPQLTLKEVDDISLSIKNFFRSKL